MRKLLIIVFTLMLSNSVSACSPDSMPPVSEIPERPGGDEEPGDNDDKMKLTIKIGTATFTATLADNSAAKTFKGMLPIKVNMIDLNRNEKYYNLSNSLPASASEPGTIQNGDLMLFGSRMLVLFYKTFSTSYSYTSIGTIDNPSGLERALGGSNVTVVFELVSQ